MWVAEHLEDLNLTTNLLSHVQAVISKKLMIPSAPLPSLPPSPPSTLPSLPSPPLPPLPSPLDLLSVEDLDGHLVLRQLVLCQLHLAKTAMTQCLSQDVPTCTCNSRRLDTCGSTCSILSGKLYKCTCSVLIIQGSCSGTAELHVSIVEYVLGECRPLWGRAGASV